VNPTVFLCNFRSISELTSDKSLHALAHVQAGTCTYIFASRGHVQDAPGEIHFHSSFPVCRSLHVRSDTWFVRSLGRRIVPSTSTTTITTTHPLKCQLEPTGAVVTASQSKLKQTPSKSSVCPTSRTTSTNVRLPCVKSFLTPL
jgi:hypothetical protein